MSLFVSVSFFMFLGCQINKYTRLLCTQEYGGVLKSVSKWKLLLNLSYKTISGHFFAICIFIFHKTEVQTVILRCLMGLNLDWFKIYGLWCKWRPCTCLANFQKIATDKWSSNYHIWPFFANCVLIFHKTEIQTVILRCLMILNLNW